MKTVAVLDAVIWGRSVTYTLSLKNTVQDGVSNSAATHSLNDVARAMHRAWHAPAVAAVTFRELLLSASDFRGKSSMLHLPLEDNSREQYWCCRYVSVFLLIYGCRPIATRIYKAMTFKTFAHILVAILKHLHFEFHENTRLKFNYLNFL